MRMLKQLLSSKMFLARMCYAFLSSSIFNNP